VKKTLKMIGALLGAIALIMAAWIVVAGPVTVFRVVRYGDTQIDDFSHYPGRALHAAGEPHEFTHAAVEIRIPPEALLDFGHAGDLDQILSGNDTIALLVLHGETIVYERYFQGHTETSLSQAFSMSKSFTSVLVGFALEDGYFQDVDQPVTDFIPELAESGFSQVTLRNLLTMMSGSDYEEDDNPFGEHVILNYTPNLEGRILGIGMVDAPGEVWRYKSGDNALLALALARALGDETITAYTQRRLWTPLGMQDGGVWTIDQAGDGLEKTWCCLAATARDFAKLGRLFLNRGEWDGQQLLSPDWIDASTRIGQVPGSAWPEEYRAVGWWNYGYQWWLASAEAGDFFALGKDGQFLYADPTTDVVVLRLGWTSGDLPSSRWIALFRTLAEAAAGN
jgi:CubicO group peptidase (beta-lactamase class C family)